MNQAFSTFDNLRLTNYDNLTPNLLITVRHRSGYLTPPITTSKDDVIEGLAYICETLNFLHDLMHNFLRVLAIIY